MKESCLVVSLLWLFLLPHSEGFVPQARLHQHKRQDCLLLSSPPSLGQVTASPQFASLTHKSCATSLLASQNHGTVRNSLRLQALRKDDESEPEASQLEGQLVPRRRRRSWRKRFRRWMLSVTLGASLFRSAPANAKFSYELRETPTSSLRPGISREQAEKIEQGEMDGRWVQAKTTLSTTEPEKQPAAAPKKTVKQSSLYGDDEDFDDEDDDFLEDEVVGSSSPRAASQADQTAAKRLQSRSNFAAYHQGKTKALTIKVGIAFFVPTYGALIVREYFRRRREEAYVQKGLEILEAQKAEYFNITNTSADSDVEDALKNLKKNETKTDDDDDDDDDEDDDDEEDDDDDEEDDRPRGRRGGPRRPLGDGGGDSGGSSGDGSGRPSDEDLDKLNQMFKRS